MSDVRGLTDAELLAQFRASRANEAFAEIVARHGRSVLRTCRRLIKDIQDAEDAAQATFLVLLQQTDRVNRPLGVWLHEVAWHTAYNLVRARIRRYRREQQAAQSPVTIPMAQATHDLRDELDAALRRLPGALREAVILRYLEGRQQDEAARLAGCPQGTLARRSMEGLNRLREVLLRRGAVLSVAAIAAFMAEEAAAAAPAKTLAGLGMLSASTVPASVALLADGASKAIFWAKVKAYALVTSLVTVTAVAPLVVMEARKPAVQYEERATLAGPSPGALAWWSAAFSADGKTLAVIHWDKTIKLWDVAGRRELHTLTADRDAFYSLAFSPDNKILAVGYGGGADGFVGVKLWDAATGQVRRSLAGHTQSVYALGYSADGKTLATASRDDTVKLWDVETGLPRSSLPVPGVYSVVISPDGKTLATGGGSRDSFDSPGAVKLWDAASGAEIANLPGHSSFVYTVGFSPDGTTLASGSYDRTVRLWDVAGRKERAVLKHSWPVVSLGFSPDSKLLASAGGKHDMVLNWIVQQPGEVRLWHAASGKELATMQGSVPPTFPAVFSADGISLVTGCTDGSIKLWAVRLK